MDYNLYTKAKHSSLNFGDTISGDFIKAEYIHKSNVYPYSIKVFKISIIMAETVNVLPFYIYGKLECTKFLIHTDSKLKKTT